MTNFDFGPIRPSFANARAMQRLKAESLLGAVKDPDLVANANNISLVSQQIRELHKEADQFAGAFINGNLQAYIQFGGWRLVDELIFATEEEKPGLLELERAQMAFTPEHKLGIYGVAASLSLPDSEADGIVDTLLSRVTNRALARRYTAINIAFHPQDPSLPVARSQGFSFTGRMGVQEGPHGVVITQRLYSKPLDSTH